MTFSENVLDQAAEDGTIEWAFAYRIAAVHSVVETFLGEYATLSGQRIDAGELLVWLGY